MGSDMMLANWEYIINLKHLNGSPWMEKNAGKKCNPNSLALAFKIPDFLLPFYLPSLFLALSLTMDHYNPDTLNNLWFLEPMSVILHMFFPSSSEVLLHHIFLEVSLSSLILGISFT